MRPSRLACLLALAASLAACSRDEVVRSSPATGPITVSSREAASAAALISAYRRANGLSPVTVDPLLNRAAEAQARTVAAAGTLSHGAFTTRMASFGIHGASAENLGAGSDTVEDVIARWKRSPGHNENLLIPGVAKVGLARADANSRYGRYWALVLSQ